MYPEPDSVIAGADVVTYVFELASQEPTTFAFNYFHEGFGPAPARVSLAGRTPVDFSHFVYP